MNAKVSVDHRVIQGRGASIKKRGSRKRGSRTLPPKIIKKPPSALQASSHPFFYIYINTWHACVT